jgi:hypothetical protein
MDEFGVLVHHFEADQWPPIEKARQETAPFLKTKETLNVDEERLNSQEFALFQADFQHSVDEASAAKNIATIAGFLGAVSAQIKNPLNMAVKFDPLVKHPYAVSKPWPEYTSAIDNLQKQAHEIRQQFKNKTTKLLETELSDRPVVPLKFENE